MKFEIMVKILLLLLSRRKLTARELADRYGISTRSVYRYIAELDICGVPMEVSRGRYGGITIADTFRLPAGFFTREEYSSAINALEAMKSQVSDESVETALEKLRRQQKNEKRELSVCGNIIIDGGTWGGSKSFTDKMRVCEAAVNERRCLMIDYISRGGEHSKRVIDPYVLIFKQNVWYIYAFCHSRQSFRTFKIGRIKSASFTGNEFTRREFTRDDVDMSFKSSDDEIIDILLEIEKSALADAEEWLGIDNIEPRGNKFIAALSLPYNGGLVNKILGYGGAVRVLAPPQLKQKIIAAATAIVQAD